MFFQLVLPWANGMDRKLRVEMPIEPVTKAIATAADAARRLAEPEMLRRVLAYAQPVLPPLAEAIGIGIAGQWLVEGAIVVAKRALNDHDVAGAPAPQPE